MSASTEWTGLKGKIGARLLGNPLRNRREAGFLKLILHHIRGHEIVLDVGAGSGYFSLPLAQKLDTGKVICLDLSTEMLERLRRKAEKQGLAHKLQILQADACSSGLEDESVDVAISSGVLHELPHPEAAVREIVRLLKTGGRLLVKDFDKDSLHGWFVGKFHHGDAHGPFTLEELEELFRRAGLRDVEAASGKGFIIGQAGR